jgi:O-antigen/teichoic acid export membrane protein
MIGNILVGLLILPYINNEFGTQILATYLKLLALKGVVDIFTSAIGGNFIKLMIETNSKDGLFLSFKVFIIYSLFTSVLFIGYALLMDGGLTLNDIIFLLFIICSLCQQPLVQRFTSLGYQHIPAIIRLIFNLTLTFNILLIPILFDEPMITHIIACMFVSICIATFVAIYLSILINDEGETRLEIKGILSFIKNSFIGYSLFAIFFSFCFQIEAIFLGNYLSDELFIILIVAFKIPNIIVQFIWRYCEVSAAEIKSKIMKIEKHLSLFSILIAIIFFFSSKVLYTLWMGETFSSNISVDLLVIFSIGIPLLSMSRLYTAFLQYTNNAKRIALQYFVIDLIKVLSIFVFIESYFLITFIVWFIIEFFGIFINRRLVLNEIK